MTKNLVKLMAEAYKDTPFDTAQSMLHVVKKHYHLVPKEEWEKFEGDERTIHLFKTKGKVYAVKEFYTRTGCTLKEAHEMVLKITDNVIARTEGDV